MVPDVNAPPSRRGRPGLSRERVVAAAVALADADGLEALTMRRLGRELGVEAMSLYNWVRNKDDVVHGMLEHVATEMLDEAAEDASARDDGGHDDWRGPVRRRAVAAHRVFLRHPWSPHPWTSRIDVGPARMRYVEAALQDLADAGLSPGLLDRAHHTVENHVVGHALQAVSFALAPEEMAGAGEAALAALDAEAYPALAAHIRHHLDHPGGDDEFTFGLDLVLDGIERLRAGG